MADSQANLTPHTAPNTLEGLMNESSFKLRLLARELGGLSTDDQKMAWHDMSDQEPRANYVLGLLQQWNQANPGARQAQPATQAPAATPPQAPAQAHAPVQAQQAPTRAPAQQSMQQAPVMNGAGPAVQHMQPVAPSQVNGAPPGPPQVATTTVQAATAAAGTGPRRSAAKAAAAPAADAGLGDQVLAALQQVIEGQQANTARLDALEKNVLSMLEAAAEAKSGGVAALEKHYNALQPTFKGIAESLQSASQTMTWTLVTLLNMAEHATGADRASLIVDAVDGAAHFPAEVNKALGKKA